MLYAFGGNIRIAACSGKAFFCFRYIAYYEPRREFGKVCEKSNIIVFNGIAISQTEATASLAARRSLTTMSANSESAS